MRNKIYVLGLIIGFLLAGWVVMSRDAEVEMPETKLFSTVTEPFDIKSQSNTELCFAEFSLATEHDGSYYRDGGSMVLDIFENKVTGSSYFQIAGKDSWFSMFDGTISNFTVPVTVNGWEQSSSEGITNEKEMVKLILDGKKVEVVRPETSDNPASTIIPAVHCEEWREFHFVQTYIQTQFDFYPDYLVLDYKNNTGYVLTTNFPDEEGEYTQQKKNISYTTDVEHAILEVKVEGLQPVVPEQEVNTPPPIVGENPEGEADPDVMKLDMKEWVWISALYNDGTEVKPNRAGDFTLTFKSDGLSAQTGTFSADTDCNSMGGKYVATGNLITFSEMMSTLMFCAESKETEFRKFLESASSYFFTGKGELVIEQKFDSGTALFR